MTNNALIGFPRTGSYFTLSGGDWDATYPVTNLQELPLSNIARTFDATTGSTIITGNATAPITVGVLALIGHNLSQSAQIRTICWSDTGASVVALDTGVEDVWPTTYSFEDLRGARWNWYRRVCNPGVDGIAVGAFQIEITDTGNTAGYIQAGYLEIAECFDPTYNFSWGSQCGHQWRSQVVQAIGGAEVVDRRDKPRLFRGNFEFTTNSDALSKFYEMERQLDMDEPFLWVPYPDDTDHSLRTVMLATLVDPGLSSLRARALGSIIRSVPVALKEVIG